MQFKDIVAKRTYKKDGVDKTTWLNVGTLKVMDDGKSFIEMNMWPNESYYVFDRKAKEPAPQPAAVIPEIVWPEDNVNPNDIPF